MTFDTPLGNCKGFFLQYLCLDGLWKMLTRVQPLILNLWRRFFSIGSARQERSTWNRPLSRAHTFFVLSGVWRFCWAVEFQISKQTRFEARSFFMPVEHIWKYSTLRFWISKVVGFTVVTLSRLLCQQTVRKTSPFLVLGPLRSVRVQQTHYAPVW